MQKTSLPNKKEYNKKTPSTIQDMFNSIAKDYDKGNALLSFQLHKYWNRRLSLAMIKQGQDPEVLLDLCCGTGDIAFSFLKKTKKNKKAILLDFCSKMLAVAKSKTDNLNLFHNNIEYLLADAQQLPLPDLSVNGVTVAYGIRNVKTPETTIKEVFRVLKPGGTFGILELTRPRYPFFRFFHNLYLKRAVPILGKWATSNQSAYQYLCQSIQHFVTPEEIISLLSKSGFHSIKKKSLSGGIATMIIAKK